MTHPLLTQDFSTRTPQEILRAVFAEFDAPTIALASSFGVEDVALIHMVLAETKSPRVFCLDTGRLPQETYDVIDRIRNKYHIAIDVYFPDAQAVQAMVKEAGMNLFYGSIDARKRCCGVRKVEPLARALVGAKAWITGLRRDQSVTRTDLREIEIDRDHGNILKINPLLSWTEKQVWDYVKTNGVPYNALHDRGYPSIGCAPCTRAIEPGEDARAGRWWWEDPTTKECGLHVKKN